MIHPPGSRVSDIRGEKFQKAHAGARTGRGNRHRHSGGPGRDLTGVVFADEFPAHVISSIA